MVAPCMHIMMAAPHGNFTINDKLTALVLRVCVFVFLIASQALLPRKHTTAS